MANRRQQPKRKVSDIHRTGSYPEVWWEHWLECGHLELRKRKSNAKQIACVQCGRAAGLVVFDETAALSEYEQKMQTKFAYRFGVEIDDVSVEVYSDGGVLKVATVTVSLYEKI